MREKFERFIKRKYVNMKTRIKNLFEIKYN